MGRFFGAIVQPTRGQKSHLYNLDLRVGLDELDRLVFSTERKFFSGSFKIGFGISYWITWITGSRAVQLISTDRCCPKPQPHPLPNQSTIVRGIRASLFNSWPSWVKTNISLFRC